MEVGHLVMALVHSQTHSESYSHKSKLAPFRWLGYKEARNTQTSAFYVANMLFNGALQVYSAFATCFLMYFHQNHVGVIIKRRALFLQLPTMLPGVIHTSPHCMGSYRGPQHAPLDTFLCSYPTIRKRSSSPMTLNHGHFAYDNKTEKLQRKTQVALAYAADCRKQLVYIDGKSGK
jgi:hypothetical protein